MNGVTVIVMEFDYGMDPYSNFMQQGRPFLAFVAGNPQLRADGATEEEAIDRLRKHILSHAGGRSVKSVKAVELRFEELLVKEVMDQ